MTDGEEREVYVEAIREKIRNENALIDDINIRLACAIERRNAFESILEDLFGEVER